MTKDSLTYQTYLKILERELVPAMGCTEPIAVAYCGAKARKLLGEEPQSVHIEASGNIIKNVKSVIVPKTGGLKGLEAAAAVGIFFGDSEAKLEVISGVSDTDAESLGTKMKEISFVVVPMETEHVLDLRVTVRGKDHEASVRIQDAHTRIVECRRNGQVLAMENSSDAISGTESEINHEPVSGEEKKQDGKNQDGKEISQQEAPLLVKDIIAFARTVDIADVKELLDRQIQMNLTIANEGLQNNYGARIGQTLMKQGDVVRIRAKALAAAGSDARMNGCNLPVVILSGSGNQGMTASLPVLEYARHYKKTEEERYRALLVSDLVTLHLKSGIGRLSAYCGAICAGAGAGAGIAFLLTEDEKVVNHTIVNALAITSGIVCDGAKASCAAKIAMAVEAGILGFEMYQEGSQFYSGDGIVSKGVENTIRNVTMLGRDGMQETDKKIIEIMTQC